MYNFKSVKSVEPTPNGYTRSRGISYMKYVNGRGTGLVTFCVETAFYNGLLKERYKGG